MRKSNALDDIHASHFAALPNDALEGLAQILNASEAAGQLPSQSVTNKMAYLLKPDGGDRPIGIMARMVRLWERIRLPNMKRWLATVHREYDFAHAGCTAEGYVWLQMLEDEALGSGSGPLAVGIATILPDIVK